jgi:hypothetical protein
VGGDDAVGFLLEGLTILRNRGYDSAGVASVGVRSDSVAGTDLVVTKYASRDSTCDSIDLVRAHASKHIGMPYVIQIHFTRTLKYTHMYVTRHLVSIRLYSIKCYQV